MVLLLKQPLPPPQTRRRQIRVYDERAGRREGRGAARETQDGGHDRPASASNNKHLRRDTPRTGPPLESLKLKKKNLFWIGIKIDADRQSSCSREQMQRKQQSGDTDSPGGEEERRAAASHAAEAERQLPSRPRVPVYRGNSKNPPPPRV